MAAPSLFARDRLRGQRARYLRREDRATFLREEIAARLAERLEDLARRPDRVLDLGADHGEIGRMLAGSGLNPALVVESDLAADSLDPTPALRVTADEEALPFAAGSFDTVLSILALHKVNDLPGTLRQIRDILSPGGVLLAALLGGDTLHELRYALAQSELVTLEGAAARIHPSIDVRDMGALLQRAGYEMPMADVDRLTVTYPSALSLMLDLRRMGETSVLADRDAYRPLRRSTLAELEEVYRSNHPARDDRLLATFDVIFITGWKPA